MPREYRPGWAGGRPRLVNVGQLTRGDVIGFSDLCRAPDNGRGKKRGETSGRETKRGVGVVRQHGASRCFQVRAHGGRVQVVSCSFSAIQRAIRPGFGANPLPFRNSRKTSNKKRGEFDASNVDIARQFPPCRQCSSAFGKRRDEVRARAKTSELEIKTTSERYC